jgi:hypothetical protein
VIVEDWPKGWPSGSGRVRCLPEGSIVPCSDCGEPLIVWVGTDANGFSYYAPHGCKPRPHETDLDRIAWL